MPVMAKRKKPTEPEPTPPLEPPEEKRRPPSRENLRYVAIPLQLHQALEQYAKDHSNEDETKSISWAARVAIRKFLVAEGRWPPKGAEGGE
jgi:hypothetical protein